MTKHRNLAADCEPGTGPSSPAAALLDWYDRHRRRMPWRAPAGAAPDPYAVWLSEVMLQQTTVATVKGYFERFLARWPTVGDLAAAPLDEVLHAWQGLGYYARARNLHRCAQEVAGSLGGRFPSDLEGLRRLPGIGPYTAAAVAAIAFGRRATVVDGNVERVVARVFRVETPLPAAKDQLHELAETLTPDDRCGDYAQAVMDLGATVCTPRRPKCMLCPWREFCAGRNGAEGLPRRMPKAERPLRHGVAYWITRDDGAVLLRQRPPRGLLGGMAEVPSTPWGDAPPPVEAAVRTAPVALARWCLLPGVVRHGFTHFRLELKVVTGRAGSDPPAEAGYWRLPDALGDEALPTLMKKVARHAMAKT